MKHPSQPVFIISYEMFVRNYEILAKINFDLVVCDEGHRLKNANIKTTSVSFEKVKCTSSYEVIVGNSPCPSISRPLK